MLDNILGWGFAIVFFMVLGGFLIAFPFQTIVVIILLLLLGKR